ncbi:hypothetical protein JDN40_03920 [Rhodomicrobium vannielii ATCC 17100]|uniref:hypothetical protein n=1 Tax=Rhodomicrobium vannielii TaxID=1069 RepID=UPI00191B01C5|nr:hypothetical protein [Rhodomicrobium vannielii]MBJ7533253.1 hypothetical protein [Rhodomicrobium vannielii ATCC 17100]
MALLVFGRQAWELRICTPIVPFDWAPSGNAIDRYLFRGAMGHPRQAEGHGTMDNADRRPGLRVITVVLLPDGHAVTEKCDVPTFDDVERIAPSLAANLKGARERYAGYRELYEPANARE